MFMTKQCCFKTNIDNKKTEVRGMRRILEFLEEIGDYIRYEVNWDFWGSLIIGWILMQILFQ